MSNATRQSDLKAFSVEVWFRTAADYRSIAKAGDETAAMREARFYCSDARGVRITRPDGSVITVKAEAAL